MGRKNICSNSRRKWNDMSYEDDQTPTFRAFDMGFLISKNERFGFSPKDLNSICTVGQSTKNARGFNWTKGNRVQSVCETPNPEIWSTSRFDSTPPNLEAKFFPKGSLSLRSAFCNISKNRRLALLYIHVSNNHSNSRSHNAKQLIHN